MAIQVLILIYTTIGLISFSLFGIDKYKAIKGKYRISEQMLLVSGAVFGVYGMIFGMLIFNHKTKKTKFRILVPIIFLLHTLIWVYILLNPQSFVEIF